MIVQLIKNKTQIAIYSDQYIIREFEKMKLEFDYLSSAEKLLEYQSLYFEKELNQKDISEIKNMKDRFNYDE